MSTSVTENIVITVDTKFERGNTLDLIEDFLFSYHIKIQNQSNQAVQLLSRHWYIFDSNGTYTEVKGEGVIGEQPIILPNQIHEYQSFCNLKTDIGMMWGTYLMKRMDDNKLFEAKIPEFQLITPSRLN
ncbi:MAG: Co2+/Mg2+ efflux protein ApaG [Bacteroidetes bacterium]|nr:MAG: Co2+/Mg2+ efflux protein ApaG [Bacteroidota bacterium]MBL1144573.1 Co2+/Mg2+ efflux protein ApaG [Bacteroidota bacterium]MCB0803378.1 Co2+/Mg2+ efflux protein ApaG [Flavobacteriales bacterium]NOG57368.1 Co2+/Mg2+ efflux protein ApaG [Bacteroidota bacterium]